jgi:hypothetical protein
MITKFNIRDVGNHWCGYYKSDRQVNNYHTISSVIAKSRINFIFIVVLKNANKHFWHRCRGRYLT